MLRILVIENDRFSSDELRSWLTNSGYVVELAESGREGLRLLQYSAFDLAVVNWQLPDMRGAEFCRLVSTSNLFLPLMIMGNSSDVNDRIAALDAGAQDFLQKPCQLPELSARLRSLLRRYTRRIEAPVPVVMPTNAIVNMPSS